MGYYTVYFGSIDINSTGIKEKVKELISGSEIHKLFDYDLDECLDLNETTINISGEWKNYHNEIEKFLLSLVKEFPDAEGEIQASGEDPMDLSFLILEDGKLFSSVATFKREEMEEIKI